MPRIVPGDASMCDALAPRLRAADLAEMEAATGLEPLAGLQSACALSDALYAVEDEDGTILAMFGAASGAAIGRPDVAIPWLLGTDALGTTHWRWLLRNTARIVRAEDHRWPRFFGLMDARKTSYVRWLRWAGFLVLPAVPWKTRGAPFHPFYREAEQPCV
jgi:hypothetical protein